MVLSRHHDRQGEASAALLDFRASLPGVDQAAALSLHGLRTKADGLRKQRFGALEEARATARDGSDGAKFVQRVEQFCGSQVEAKLEELERSLDRVTVRACVRVSKRTRAVGGCVRTRRCMAVWPAPWHRLLTSYTRGTPTLMASQVPTRAVGELFATGGNVSPEHALDKVRAFVAVWAQRLEVARRRFRSQNRGGFAGAGAGGAGGAGSGANSGLAGLLARRRRAVGSTGDSDDSD